MSELEEFEAESGDTDAFANDDAFASLIVLMRIYDVLMADLTIKDEAKAQAILLAHAKGHLVGPVPAYSGLHMTTVQDDEGSGELDKNELDS